LPVRADAGRSESGCGGWRESLEKSFQMLRDALANELLETIKNGAPAAFERIVVDLFVAMG